MKLKTVALMQKYEIFDDESMRIGILVFIFRSIENFFEITSLISAKYLKTASSTENRLESINLYAFQELH